MTTDPATAARRVAEHLRSLPPSVVNAGVPAADLLALLPFLDAVARGAEGDRVERWARALSRADGNDPNEQIRQGDGLVGWRMYIPSARAAIALADAEAAGRREAGWRAYEEARDTYGAAERMLERVDTDDPEDNVYVPAARREVEKDRAALDAAVRGITGEPT